MRLKKIQLVLAAFVALPTFQLHANPTTLTIEGWPGNAPQANEPSPRFGDDPVFGRLACPSLTRLDLQEGISKAFVAKEVKTTRVGDKTVWSYTLRPSTFWWSGKEFNETDLKDFFANLLNGPLGKRLDNFFGVPKFDLESSAGTVKITWHAEPKFGPYIFDGIPVWRKAKAPINYECIGRYEITANTGTEITLQPTKSLGGAKHSLRFVRKDSKAAIQFRMAGDFAERANDPTAMSEPKCANILDMPVVTAIAWNLKSPLAGSPEVRKLLTQSTPRGELARTATGYLGELISGPILRRHPGYDGTAKVRPFNLDDAVAGLDRLGYKRPSSEGPRKDTKGNPIKIRLVNALAAPTAVDHSTFLLTKLLADSFAALGVEATFEAPTAALGSQDFDAASDGTLFGWSLPWPSLDFIYDFHSKATARNPFRPLHDKDLDAALIDYSLSLTHGKPDFAKLRHVHRRIFELEPFSILVQHRICVNFPQESLRRALPANPNDPDWFWQFIQ